MYNDDVEAPSGYENIMLDEFIEKEMQRIKTIALSKIPNSLHFQTRFALMFAIRFFDSETEAVKLAHELDLCTLDFLAIQEDFEAFKQHYMADEHNFINTDFGDL